MLKRRNQELDAQFDDLIAREDTMTETPTPPQPAPPMPDPTTPAPSPTQPQRMFVSGR